MVKILKEKFKREEEIKEEYFRVHVFSERGRE
jgi:hypothetical protein